MFYCIALLAALLAPPAKDPPKWFEVSSDHFLLFTDTSEAKGRRLVSDFENRVAALSQVLGKVPDRQFRIEIFLFSEETDLVEALPRVQGVEAENQLRKNAHFLRGPDRIFIVAKDKSPEDIANDVGHALGHAFFERYVIWRPFWLAEGAAEYFRKVGRSGDAKRISEEEGFTAADMFTIAPSATYKDNDPPTIFRAEAYKLFRLVLEENSEVLRQYLQSLRTESDKLPKIPLDGESMEQRFREYIEPPLKPLTTSAAMQASEVDDRRLAIHRGDLLLASGRDAEAARWYNADSPEARAARAILVRFSRTPVEALRLLDRTAREIPGNGLVQYHFGALEVREMKDVQLQEPALERAVQLLPLMGRAHAELARVYAQTGQAEKGLALTAKALELEPEYADRFYEIRADVYLALGRSSDAIRAASIASDLPHIDRSAVEHFVLRIAEVRKRIETARREVDAQEMDSRRAELRAEADRREPPPKPLPPPPPVPPGDVSYEIVARAPIEVVSTEYPDYPEALRTKGVAGSITLQVDIGPDGKVRTASVVSSQVQDLNKSALDAIKKWTFKPGNRSFRLVLKFALQ